jgi:N-methylhydantoinase A
VFSAWGMMMSDLRRDYFVTRLATLDHGAPSDGIEAAFAATEAQARAQFSRRRHRRRRSRCGCNAMASSATRIRNIRSKCKLSGPVTDAGLDPHRRLISTAPYEREYTYRLNAPVEMVGLHVVATAEVGKLTDDRRPP